ncbi:FixH family protein [Pseudogracilibacillus sp. SO30301A]|uniref:FixH family protein n=1 Tax=Pseudogracilibacillus sp. SO30301A TaxID=3098291 RepID=UPI00300DF709
MTKKEITVGEGGDYDHEEHGEDEHGDHGFHTEGFDMHFMEPENVTTGEDTELMVHLMMHEDALEEAEVRYEIWQDDVEDSTEWVDAEEINTGEYIAQHSFEEAGNIIFKSMYKTTKIYMNMRNMK